MGNAVDVLLMPGCLDRRGGVMVILVWPRRRHSDAHRVGDMTVETPVGVLRESRGWHESSGSCPSLVRSPLWWFQNAKCVAWGVDGGCRGF